MIRQSGLYTNPADRLYFVSRGCILGCTIVLEKLFNVFQSLLSFLLKILFAIFREYTLDVYRMTSVVTEVSANN